MTDAKRKHFEDRLQEERRKVLDTMEDFDETLLHHGEDDGDISHYPMHLADEGTDTMEREKEYLLASKEGEQLVAIDRALEKIYSNPDAYGVCEECGGVISEERLEIVPWATLCIDDERKAEAT